MRRWLLAMALMLVASLVGPATGAIAAIPLSVSKTTTTVSDPQNDTLPKAIPGSALDYTVSVTNPVGGATNVSGIVYVDTIAPKTMLYVLDLNTAGGGPIVFNPGSTLGVGGSTLTYSYSSLSSTTDQLDFSSDGGMTWTYTPVPDANGCDGLVTNIRIRPSGTQAVGSTFKIRYRIMVR